MFQKHLLNVFLIFIFPSIVMWLVIFLQYSKEDNDE